MRNIIRFVLPLVIGTGLVSSSFAAVERDLDKREVESDLRKFGGEHYFEDIKIREIGEIETEVDEEEDQDGNKAFYWIYSTILPDDAGYRIIIYDNEPRYLGYYDVPLSPINCGEGTIVFEQGDFDLPADPITGDTDTWSVEIPDSGPPKRIQIGGNPVSFVAAPTIEEVKEEIKEEREAAAAAASSGSSTKQRITPEYRSWQINAGGRMITVESAIFVEYKSGQVTIKDGKTGRTKAIPLRNFSEADQQYLRQLIR